MTISRRGRTKTAKKSTKKLHARVKLCFVVHVFGTIHSSPLSEVANSIIIIVVYPIKVQLRENHVPKKALHLSNVTSLSVQRKSDQPQKVTTKFLIQSLGSFMVHQSVQCSLLNCYRDVLRSFSHSYLRCFTVSCSRRSPRFFLT